MFGALALALFIESKKPDDVWFRCRALAENVKSLAWRYVMDSVPSGPTELAKTDEAYLENIARVRERLQHLEKHLAKYPQASGGLITEWMMETRSLPFHDKLGLFVKQRIEDQRSWYEKKAAWNARMEAKWMYAVFTIEFVAIIAAVLQALFLLEFSVVGGIAAGAAGLVAWVRTKRFSDLANSYRVAADDLGILAEKAKHVHTEADLPQLVAEVEAAISREHTMWVARRAN